MPSSTRLIEKVWMHIWPI